MHRSEIFPLVSVQGQERLIRTVCNISAVPPKSRHFADIPEPPLSANRLYCQFRNLREGTSLSVLVPIGSHAAQGLS